MKLKCEAQIIKITSVKTCRKAEFFGPDLHLPLERLEYNTHYTDTLYADSDIRHELFVLVLTSLIYRSTVSRMPFISSFTVLRHDLRRIRMRNDGIGRARARARVSLARPLRSFVYSFLPSFLSLHGFRRVSVSRL